MGYRSLLVHLDRDARAAVRTQAALNLAREFDAHLLGVAPTGLVDLPVAFDASATLGQYGALAWDLLRGQANEAAQAFRDACAAAGHAAFAAQVEEDNAAAALVRHAHCADLCILSQADPGADGHRAHQALVERVVLHSARPTLILPYAGPVERFGRQVLVAWDDSRESARAVNDALPLLHRAQRVRVLSWVEAGSADDADWRARGAAVGAWLQRHGVQAEVAVEATVIGIGEAMLSRAAELGADLIVMGAYGHTRLAERVLGGATRGLLQAMTVPVLMSH